MKKNEKTPAGRTKDRILGLVRTLAEQLEEEYRSDTNDLIDPHVLALNVTRNFVKDLYAATKAAWEAAVLVSPPDPERNASWRLALKAARKQNMKENR